MQWREVCSAEDVRRAARRLEPVGVVTPLQRSARLSERFAAEVLLKREDLQEVRSYKIRGAYNFVASLPSASLRAGVVCASAGNHAQGVAWTCRKLGVPGVIFVPFRTPRQKVQRIRHFGGPLVDLRFAGETFDDALATAEEHALVTGASLVPAFDAPGVVAGQGTCMLEILDQVEGPPDIVVCPVGGGGLIAGVGLVAEGSDAPVVVIGAQPAGAPAMVRSLAAGEPLTVPITDDFVDGAAVRTPGVLTLAMVRDLVDRLILVGEGRVCTEQLELYQEEGIVAEPAGALALAALDDLADELRGRRVVCLLSGGNNDVARYAEILERSLVDRGLKHYFLVEFPQQPGALRRFLDDCLGPTDDIVLFEYVKKQNRELGPALVGIELAEPGDLEPLLRRITASGLGAHRVEPDTPLFHLLV